MQEIKCPKCGEVFVVDESGYAQIVQQVRDREFDKEIKRREEELSKKKDYELKIARAQQKEEYDKIIEKKEKELSEKKTKITELQGKLESSAVRTELEISKAVHESEQEISEKKSEIIRLEEKLKSKQAEYELKEQALQQRHKEELELKEEQIQYYRDFKARQSTKMVGESLEQHCLTQFNSLRMTAFANAYFEKDNDARTGSKGDFIFRDYVGGIEFISIMFEMKNEMDETATKHKNEDLLKELDKDRREKNCEYAVLVSLLEMDSELYNNGIVDVSYKYEKMYVIRPQFFIPIITLLRNAALNSLQYRQELEVARNQQIDIVNFEEKMNDFKKKFEYNYGLASRRFQEAIKEIDNTIEQLEKTKAALLSSENNLRLANKKASELTIKKLTKDSPMLREQFDQLKST